MHSPHPHDPLIESLVKLITDSYYLGIERKDGRSPLKVDGRAFESENGNLKEKKVVAWKHACEGCSGRLESCYFQHRLSPSSRILHPRSDTIASIRVQLLSRIGKALTCTPTYFSPHLNFVAGFCHLTVIHITDR